MMGSLIMAMLALRPPAVESGDEQRLGRFNFMSIAGSVGSGIYRAKETSEGGVDERVILVRGSRRILRRSRGLPLSDPLDQT